MKQWYVHFHLSHLRWWRSPSSSSALGNGRQLVIRHLLWTRLSVKRAMTTMYVVSACRLYSYTRLNGSHDSIKSTASRYVTFTAHFHPGLVLQLGSWYNLQVGYQISTGRPRLKRNHRQEGIPPSWLRLIVSACQCQTDYRWLRNAIVGMRG